MPGSRRAFYLHSGLPDDLGIQYQSYGEDDIVAEDEHVLVWPGLGHTVIAERNQRLIYLFNMYVCMHV